LFGCRPAGRRPHERSSLNLDSAITFCLKITSTACNYGRSYCSNRKSERQQRADNSRTAASNRRPLASVFDRRLAAPITRVYLCTQSWAGSISSPPEMECHTVCAWGEGGERQPGALVDPRDVVAGPGQVAVVPAGKWVGGVTCSSRGIHFSLSSGMDCPIACLSPRLGHKRQHYWADTAWCVSWKRHASVSGQQLHDDYMIEWVKSNKFGWLLASTSEWLLLWGATDC
jgi:hypothetical protein